MPPADAPREFPAAYAALRNDAPPDTEAAIVVGLLALLPPAFAPPLATASGAVTGTVAPAAAAGTPPTDDYSDQAVRGDIARQAFGVSGAGIKVGILSDSFDVLGGAAQDIAEGGLPAGGVTVLEEGPAGSHDEGRAMADLIHRIAPGAQIMFHTATNGEADFAAGIAALAAAGCQVIVDDVAYLDEPFFQDAGAVQTAVAQAVAQGVSYFTAAGNAGADYVQMGFVPLHLALSGLPAGAAVQNFGTAAAPQPWLPVTIPPGGEGLFDLQWNQPLGAAAASLGFALYDAAGTLVAGATQDQVGGNPDQVIDYVNAGPGSAFRLVVYANGGIVPPGLFKIIAYGTGSIASPLAGQGSGSVIGHQMVPGANTVGAMAWSAAPRFGGSDVPESFSSVGSGLYLRDGAGAPLAQPQSTQKVDFLAPDGSITSTLAPFYGTSAAAANAAGVAALVLSADPALTPAQLTQVLEVTAAPANGPTLATGAGLLQADAAVQMALGMAHAPPAG